MNYLPKRPSELVATMTEQYEERELDRFGREIRGGRGKKKGKPFFRVSSDHPLCGLYTLISYSKAHLTWYGFEYNEDDTREELEEQLWEAMTARPPPSLPQEIFEVEARMRQMWLNAAADHQELWVFLSQCSNSTNLILYISLLGVYEPRGPNSLAQCHQLIDRQLLRQSTSIIPDPVLDWGFISSRHSACEH